MFLQIRNFNLISSARIELNGLTVIAGENNTGKSTVGKLLFSMIKAHNMTRARSKNLAKADQEKTMKQLFSLVFGDPKVKNAEAVLGNGQEGLIDFKTDAHGWMTISGGLKRLDLGDATYVESPVVWSLMDFFKTVGKLKEHSDMYGIGGEITYPYLLWDTYKKLSVKSKYIPNRNEEETCQQVLQRMRSVVGGQIVQSMEDFYFVREQDQARFPVPTIATGIKSFGILQVLTEHRWIHPSAMLIIDEPEVHLHPKWEVEFASLIAQFVKMGVKVVVTTHSAYMVKALREFTKDIPSQVNFYLSNPDEGGIQTKIEDVTQETYRIFKKFADPLSDLTWRTP